MPRRTARTPALALLLSVAAMGSLPLGAQQARLPDVRPLAPILARTTEPMGAVSTIAPLPGGRVLVNDILGKRVVLFDSSLALVRVVADSTMATENAYGARGGGLLSYNGDSALFLDPASLTMMGITPDGMLAGVKAVPRANDITLLVGGPNGRPGIDAQGRMVYRGQARGAPAPANARPTIGNFVMPQQPDSAPIVRVDPATRKLDTLAMIKIPKVDINISQGADGRISVQTKVNPMPVTDDWAFLSDGRIAIVRGHDFHVDWVDANKQVTTSPKIPYEWQRLSDEEKETFLDSARTAMEKQRAEAQRMIDGAGGPMAFMAGGGGEQVMMRGAFSVLGGDGSPPPRVAAAPAATPAPSPAGAAGASGTTRADSTPRPGRAGAAPGGFQIPPINLVPASELPDYRPPFGQQSALGDLEGNLWVRTTAPVGESGPVYFVIDGRNEVVARMQAPQGRIIVGFGKQGLVYLAFRDADGRSFMEAARWR